VKNRDVLAYSTAIRGTLHRIAPIGWGDLFPPPRRNLCPHCKGDPISSDTVNCGHGDYRERFTCAQHHSWMPD
jgi:hypothetical protein